MQLRVSFSKILLFPVFFLFRWRLLLLNSLFRRAGFMEVIFTMASAAVRNLPLKKQFLRDGVGHCHEARNIPCFNVLIQKEDNVPQANIDLMTESMRLPNHFLHDPEPSKVQSKFPIRDEWAPLYCYKELLSSKLCL